jgi:hypothetical protein
MQAKASPIRRQCRQMKSPASRRTSATVLAPCGEVGELLRI